MNQSVVGDNLGANMSSEATRNFSPEFLTKVLRSSNFLRLPFEK